MCLRLSHFSKDSFKMNKTYHKSQKHKICSLFFILTGLMIFGNVKDHFHVLLKNNIHFLSTCIYVTYVFYDFCFKILFLYTLLLWQAMIPLYSDRLWYPSTLTGYDTFLLWQNRIPFHYGRLVFPFVGYQLNVVY